MSTSLLLLLALIGFALLLFALTRSGNNAEQEHSRQQQPPQGYPPNYILYPQPPPQQPEPPVSDAVGRSMLLMLLLAAAALVFYLLFQAGSPEKMPRTGEENNKRPYYENDSYYLDDYNYPDTGSANGPVTEKKTGDAQTEQQEKKNFPTVEYRGYGVQLFAREKDWWGEPGTLSLENSLQNLYLLIGTGYTSDGVEVKKFLIGPFQTKKEADYFADWVSNQYPGAFSLSLDSLKRVERYRVPLP